VTVWRPTSTAPLAGVSAAAHHAGHGARKAAGSAWVTRLVRYGYFVRGIIYVVPGVLALQLALGGDGAAATQTGAAMTQVGAIEMIGRQPFGRVLLAAVAVGLAGYVLWGVIRAVFDPLDRGHSPRGLATRFGFASSAIAYVGFLAVTLGIVAGPLSHVAAPPDWTAGLLAKPFGAWIVGIIGLFWIAGAGIGEIARGWQGSFERDLELDRMGHAERWWMARLGRVGTVTRGVVFTTVGIFLVATALHANPHHATGMDGALLGLERQPFGRVLLAGAAVGLIVFGVFSMLSARWARIRVTGRAPLSQRPLSTSM
jgi:hypothetical protein